MIGTTRLRLAALAAAMSLALPAVAQDKAATTPQTTTATYQAWTLRCDNAVGTPPHRVCEVAQAIAAPDGKSALAQIVIGRPEPGKPLKLIVQVPSGVWLPANAVLALDDKTTVTATYKRCVQLCFADTDLDATTVAALKARKDPIKLLFANGNQRIVELPVSLDGFSAALEQSLREAPAK